MLKNNDQENLRILFVDDEEGVLRSLQRLFIDEDFEIFTASSGKAGLDILKSNNIAVIVSDQRMPEMSGAEFLEKAGKLAPDSVKIVLTGYADINAAMDAINKGGAYRYITKPWNDNDLIITVLNAAERFKLIKENRYLTELTKKQNEELKKWSSELEIYVQKQTIELTNQNKELKRLNEKLRKDFNDFIFAFFNIIELRNKVLHSHSSNVANIASVMAGKMGLKSSEIETITIAAMLHDIGMIGLPDIVLLKNFDELTADETDEYLKHPVRGQAAIDPIEDLREAGGLIRHHHERHNGKGFPDKLKGQAIPVGSRIIGIADKFDRLITLSHETHNVDSALQKVHSLSGTQFDPDLYKFLNEAAREQAGAVAQTSDTVQVELSPKDLMPGLVVARDLRSGTGLLLLSKGIVLNKKNIDTIRRSYHLDPSKTGVFVWTKRQMQKT